MYARNVHMMLALVIMVPLSSVAFAGKPLKLFVLAGQSNMQGMARVYTIDRLNMSDDAREMYNDMMIKDGFPSPVKDVHGVYFTSAKGKVVVKKGPLKPGYEGEMTRNSTFGPEYTFGIYMQKHLNEPFLIIKTAWGGKDLLQQFRPPSAGAYEKEKDKGGNPTGHYYRLMIKHVKEVLSDPSQYYPAYNKEAGYDIAGFVWFQGVNDTVAPYPKAAGGNQKDFSEYSRLMACFIRDVRKDLDAPKMPFVIGVLGVGGVKKNDPFRIAQEAPAALPEFKGNVMAIRTGQYWDMELQRLNDKLHKVRYEKVIADNPKLKDRPVAARIEISKLRKTMTDESILTPEEFKLYKVAKSNAPYHYMGSAYTYGNIGKAFADAMAKMMK